MGICTDPLSYMCTKEYVLRLLPCMCTATQYYNTLLLSTIRFCYQQSFSKLKVQQSINGLTIHKWFNNPSSSTKLPLTYIKTPTKLPQYCPLLQEWWRPRDSNPYTRRYLILSQMRLPVTPDLHFFVKRGAYFFFFVG